MFVKWSVSAAGMGLWPQGLHHPGASNWGDWYLGAATGQTVSDPTCWGELHCKYMYICFILMYMHPDETEDEALCPHCVCVSVVFSFCVGKCDQVYVNVKM